MAFYRHHADSGPLNTSWCLYTPDVEILGEDWVCSFLSCAAPNAAEARRYGYSMADVRSVLEERAARIVRVAAAHDHTELVLGAWGCGVFGNDPELVVSAFLRTLGEGAFGRVVFAIRDLSPDQWSYRTFRRKVDEHG